MGDSPVDRMEIFHGDITTLAVDAIVNAANTALAPGAGVCGAIHRAAGPKLAMACAEIGSCPTGEARMTPGFDLPAKHIIHAVGPVWRGGGENEAELLASCYCSSLELAANNGLASIAFPAISTGVYGYPLSAAAELAVGTVRAYLSAEGAMDKVIFAVFGEEAEAAYRTALSR
jgi:O-acetyl-ADP-ribose deacetylase (regulator of RNase III)